LNRPAPRVFAVVTMTGFLVAMAMGCTEQAVTPAAPDQAPGPAPQTVEIELGPQSFVSWQDTTFTGFAVPNSAASLIVADDGKLRGRTLVRFPTLPDSIGSDTARAAVARFDSARVRLVIDTLRSTFGPLPVRLTAYSLRSGFVGSEATWTESSAGTPWRTPGGDLGVILGTVDVGAPTDTVLLPLSLVSSDSLLADWLTTAGGKGLALTATGSGSRLQLSNVSLTFVVQPEGQDTIIRNARSPNPRTFIFDPPPPPVGAPLRVGGLPAARTYLSVVPPESFQGTQLRGSTINRAELFLRPLPPPAEPFVQSQLRSAAAVRLLADPFQFGRKTPIGGSLAVLPTRLDPDSLAAGIPVGFDLTGLFVQWAAADPDSLSTLRFGVRPLPEGGELGFWSFGSAEQAPDVRPFIRLLVTPPTAFQLP